MILTDPGSDFSPTIVMLSITLLFSGSINGYIYDENDTPLMGANIIVVSTDIGNTTDEEGYFNIDVFTNQDI